MAVARRFGQTVKERANADPAFRAELRREATEAEAELERKLLDGLHSAETQLTADHWDAARKAGRAKAAKPRRNEG